MEIRTVNLPWSAMSILSFESFDGRVSKSQENGEHRENPGHGVVSAYISGGVAVTRNYDWTCEGPYLPCIFQKLRKSPL